MTYEFVWTVNFGQDPMNRTDDTRVEISRSTKDHGMLNSFTYSMNNTNYSNSSNNVY